MWNKIKGSWISWTMLFALMSAGLFVLTLWNPMVGLLVILLLVCTLFVGTILKAYVKNSPGQYEGYQDHLQKQLCLQERELKDSKSLLRYATAILSFLSLMTTAQGMKNFVFGETWMAYLGSFAIQSILVVFSLLLCRFYVQIMILSWPFFVKRIANGILTIFFSIALVISSTFSFSYIANNAYAHSSASDSDTTIRTYLMSAVQELQKENQQRGRELLAQIPATARDRLGPAMEKAQGMEIENYQKELKMALAKVRTISHLELGGVDIDWSAYREEAHTSELELLQSSYENIYKKTYDQAVDSYNSLLDKIEGIKNGDLDHLSTLEDLMSEIQNIKNSLQATLDPVTGISSWRTSNFNNDIAPYRSTYTAATNNLLGLLDSLEQELSEAETWLDKINRASTSNASQELGEIMKQIYLLGVDDTIHVSNLTDQIAKLAVQASAENRLSSEEILNVVALRDDLTNYERYLNLKNGIQKFQDENLRKVYYINDNKAENAPDSTYVEVTKQEWKDARNRDFYVFFDLLKQMPEVGDEKTTEFDSAKILKEASTIQRDLLGELTDFERAFNYFKYDFKAMAYFSAFVAVFFDLGAFLTGCFLFCTEFFKTSEEVEQNI